MRRMTGLRRGVAGAAVLAAAVAAAPAEAARNLVDDALTAQGDCAGLTVHGWGGFVPGEGLGQCSVRLAPGSSVERGAQGRIAVAAPAGTRIARIREWRVWVDAHTSAISTEAWWNTTATGGDVRVADYGNGDLDQSLGTLHSPDPAGANAFYLAARSHADFPTPQLHFMALTSGAVDLWDEQAPSVTEVSLDGGEGWTRETVRRIRFVVTDNLGARGLGAAQVHVSGQVVDQEVSPAPGGRVRQVDLSGLPDGEHLIAPVALNAGVGDLPAAWGAAQTVRIDRTAPTAPTAVTGGPGGWTARPPELTPVGAHDAHSGVAGFEWRSSPDQGRSWSDPGDSPVPPGLEGRVQLQVRARDAVGNLSPWAAAGSVAVDTGAPQLTVALPPGRLAGTSSVTADASDAVSGVREVVIERRLVGREAWNPVGTLTRPPYAAALDPDTLARGTHELRVTARDHAGNQTAVVREIVVDAQGATARAESTSRDSAAGPRPAAAESAGAVRAVVDPTALVRLNRGMAARTGGAVRFRITHPGRRRLTLTGRLEDTTGTGLAGRTLEALMGTRAAGRAQTGADGGFTLVVDASGVGPLTLRTDGATLRTYPVTVTPAIRASASAGVRVGRVWRVSGRVSPSPAAQGARRHIALLYGVDTRRCPGLRHVVAAGRVFARPAPGATEHIAERCWRLVASARVDARGRFRLAFDGFAPLTLRGRPYPGGFRYAAYFQVRVPATEGWKAEPGRSRTLRLTVSG